MAIGILVVFAAVVAALGAKKLADDRENSKIHILEGVVTKVRGTDITFKKDPENRNSYRINITDILTTDADGNKITAEDIQEGQTIVVQFTGVILASAPAQITGILQVTIK